MTPLRIADCGLAGVGCAAVVCAAGSSSRLGGKVRKPYLKLLGKPVLAWTLKALSQVAGLRQIVIVTRPEDAPAARAAARQARLARGIKLGLVDGGARRQDSVLNGLRATSPECELVLIHDAARPFPAQQAMAEACAQARVVGAAILASRVKDTVKRETTNPSLQIPNRRPDASVPVTQETVPRAGLWLAQTPQVFRRKLILELFERLAREAPEREVTDDAAVCEAYGLPVALVPSPQTNLKITRPEDVPLAEAYLKGGLISQTAKVKSKK